MAVQLKNLGFECDCAKDGEQAIEHFRQRRRYALILMDVMMPKMNGYDATKGIREIESGESLERTPIIAMTSLDDCDNCAAYGMDDYYRKPVTFAQLKELTTKWAIDR